MGLARCAVVRAQIETGLLRFDASQYQRPSAPGAGRPEIVDKLEIERICHDTHSERLNRSDGKTSVPLVAHTACGPCEPGHSTEQ
jgi:hypothetical protein